MSKINLTTEMIAEMARFAGLIVDQPSQEELEVEYVFDDELEIIDYDEYQKYKGPAIYMAEYPDEGALPLSMEKVNWNDMTEQEIEQLRTNNEAMKQ